MVDVNTGSSLLDLVKVADANELTWLAHQTMYAINGKGRSITEANNQRKNNMGKVSNNLFRGKGKRTGKWEIGSLLEFYNGKSCYINPNSCGDLDDVDFGRCFIHVSPKTVGQYTGKGIKNQWLFVGDIISVYGHIKIVRIRKNGFGFCLVGIENIKNKNLVEIEETPANCWWKEMINLDAIEIIGNITDNPELME